MTKPMSLFEKLRAGLEDAVEHERGHRVLRVHDVVVPAPPRHYGAEEIRQLRESLHLSQAAFALLLQVSHRTVQSWEQGLRSPAHSAARLLQFIEQPELLDEVIALKH